ncbi:MAG: maleylacetate reductase [Rhodospirillaceae bacterium]
MQPFVYTAVPYRVVFGPGTAATLKDEIEKLDAKRALFVCTPGREGAAERMAATVAPLAVGVCPRALPFTPIEAVEEGRRMARERDADCLVIHGGGNATGFGKAIALELDIPMIALPTTYAGSETTYVQGIRYAEGRRNHYSLRMLAKTLIYDPELSADLPLSVSIPSGIHSTAHAVGSFFGKHRNPVTTLMAEEGIRVMGGALPRIAANPKDIEARGEALYGAWLCGTTVMSSSTVIHHKICHVLAGDFRLTHAETNTIILPHATAYNRTVAPDAMRRIARAFGDAEGDAPAALYDLMLRSGAPRALKDIGMPEDGLDRAADQIMVDQYYNPRPYDRAEIRALLDDAFHGRPPAAG